LGRTATFGPDTWERPGYFVGDIRQSLGSETGFRENLGNHAGWRRGKKVSKLAWWKGFGETGGCFWLPGSLCLVLPKGEGTVGGVVARL